MTCPACRHENRPTAKFCESCGGKLPQRCPACGAALRAIARFCDACGAALPAAPAAAPPPAPLPSLEAQFDTLQHEGRVDRFLGDGLLAVFGTPQAHESDPERAILAGLAIRDLFIALSKQQPVILVREDLHWADSRQRWREEQPEVRDLPFVQ